MCVQNRVFYRAHACVCVYSCRRLNRILRRVLILSMSVCVCTTTDEDYDGVLGVTRGGRVDYTTILVLCVVFVRSLPSSLPPYSYSFPVHTDMCAH